MDYVFAYGKSVAFSDVNWICSATVGYWEENYDKMIWFEIVTRFGTGSRLEGVV